MHAPPIQQTVHAVALALFGQEDENRVHELRVLTRGYDGTVSGYFNQWNPLARAAAAWSGKADSVYFTLNPTKPDLLARANNRAKPKAKETTADVDIVRREWLLVDFDPKRPSGISSTDAEHESAQSRAAECREWLLNKFGWPTILHGDSGNGAHLLVRVDLPNDDAAKTLCETVLKTLAQEWDQGVVCVDTTTFNAARICTLYGTMKGKGDSIPSRPHRPARLFLPDRLPDVWEAATTDQLQAVADLFVVPAPPPSRNGNNFATSGGFDAPFDMEGFIHRHGLVTGPPLAYQGGTKWQMDCPFNSDHRSPDAFLSVTASGAAAFTCSHHSCQNNRWQALRDKLEPFPKAGRAYTESPQRETRSSPKQAASNEATAEPEPFPLTDLGNAERLIHYHGHELRFNSSWGWLIWTGKRWKVDETGEIYLRVEDVVRKIPLEAAALARKAASLDADDERRDGLNKRAQAVLQWAVKSEAAQRIKACAELAEHQPGIPAAPTVFDADPLALNVQNGILDLKTGVLKPHHPAALCSKICPIEYKPDALAPLWESCLATWQPDAEVRAFLARAAGYSLTGQTGEETAFLLYGLGRNGKSKFTAALEYILGDYAGRAPIDIFMQGKGPDNGPTPDKANLVGLRFVVASEIVQARKFNEAFVKDVTGGDSITAAHKHMKPFTFKPLLKLWFYGNHKPVVSGADDGIKARLPLVPFTVTIPVEQRDPDLDAKLQAEAEGILAWTVRGCMDWQKKRLAPPAAVVEASADYHNEMDTLHGFFAARCIFGEGKQIWTPTADLRNALTEWAREEGIDERALPKPNELAERLRREGCDDNGGKVKKIAGKSQRAWSNVRLRTDADLTEDEKEPKSESKTPENAPNNQKVTPVTPGNASTGFLPLETSRVELSDFGVTGVTGVTSKEKQEVKSGVDQGEKIANLLDELRPEFENERQIVDFWKGRIVWFYADAQRVALYWPDSPDRNARGGGWVQVKAPVEVPASDMETMRRTHAERMARVVEIEG